LTSQIIIAYLRSSERKEYQPITPITEKLKDQYTMADKKYLSVGFMGCGMMASALMEGLVNKKVVKDPSSITCSDVYPPSAEKPAMKGYSATKSNDEACNNANDVIVIAVKPNVVEDVCMDISKINSGRIDYQYRCRN
jgi:hypothetical protein